MTTFSALVTAVSSDLSDTANKTFTTDVVGDLINEALIEIGRIAPGAFQEDITPVADTLVYQLRRTGATQALTTPFGAESTNLLTSAAHGLSVGSAIRFLTLTGGTGLVVGTTYYVIASGFTANAFKVALAIGGNEVDFTANITAGTFAKVGTDEPVPEIRLTRVEVWDKTVTPHKYVGRLRPMAGEYSKSSPAGWYVWNGSLYLTNATEELLDPATHLIRVWGEGPYPIVSGATVVPVSVSLEWAIRAYCRVVALKRLTLQRDLFTQWQGQSNNSDVSPAALLSALAEARDDWRRQARSLLVLQEAP